MSQDDPQFLEVETQGRRRPIAIRKRPGASPAVVWLGGFRSDMTATKAEALDSWARRSGRAFLRFDYAGHGQSGGRFEDFTLTDWLGDGLAVIDAQAGPAPVLVGSSMGGWIALLAARRLLEAGAGLTGMVLIAPAVDFTQELIWAALPPDIQRQIIDTGLWQRHSAYSPDPYPITRALIEDGRRHLLLNGPIRTGCPVHILQGMQDEDVPWRHALRLVEHLPGNEVVLTLVKDGDHRLSRPQDLARLAAAVEAIAASPIGP